MLKIKLARFGKRKQPHYRIVINEDRTKRDGKYVEMIGAYAPTQIPKELKIDLKRYDYWISQGAQPTDTVASLAKKYRSGDPFPVKKQSKAKKDAKEAKKKKAVKEVVEKQSSQKKVAKKDKNNKSSKKKQKKTKAKPKKEESKNKDNKKE
ncbi:MAG: 30S ribosomal protein S16 [Patescibacteria group bacterium]|nr:30S ribosomal protein S16 [Patescibacteria group bacterium]